MWLFWPLKLCLRISEFWTPCSLPRGALDKCNLCPTNSLRLSFRGPNNHKNSTITIAMKRKKDKQISPGHLSPVTCHMSPVTCQVSHVICHLSHVTCHMSLQEQPQQQTLLFVTPPQSIVVGPRITTTKKMKNRTNYCKRKI